jgi:uncharacterized repeat protein (TIGR03803 family)
MLKRTVKPYWLVAATLLLPLAALDGANASGYHIFYSFKGGGAGREPIGSVLIDDSGNLAGTVQGSVYQLTPDGDESVLYRFPHGSRQDPRSGVIADNLGNLYGITPYGGSCAGANIGCGVVFKIAPDGTETTLHAFQGGTDGAVPSGGLVMDGTGNLYGTTGAGGENCNCGTVFKITPDGTETVLHAFQEATEGWTPAGGVILDSSGNLYGTTVESPQDGPYTGYGTVFKLSPDGTQTILYSFKGRGSSDGEMPFAPLVMDAAGNLYGTTAFGGDAESCDAGCGTVFKLSPGGREKVLHEFHGDDGFVDAYGPGLVLDSAGNLYGVAHGGSGTGCGNGCGIVFKMSPHGKEKVLHNFEGGTADGSDPRSSLTFYNGDLYGTTYAGGIYGFGTVFRLKP